MRAHSSMACWRAGLWSSLLPGRSPNSSCPRRPGAATLVLAHAAEAAELAAMPREGGDDREAWQRLKDASLGAHDESRLKRARA